MKVEIRPKRSASTGGDSRDHLILISESEAESKLIDKVIGPDITEIYATFDVMACLSDGYGEHYLRIRKHKEGKQTVWRG